MSSHFADVNGWRIWYERYGSGPLPLLLIPGAIGTAKTDFSVQLEGGDALDQDKFTIIAVEAPGWGRIRPPPRPYGQDVYNNDSECFHQLMTGLGFEKFCVLGWSDGAITAMCLGCRYPDAVIKMALQSILVYPFPKTVAALQASRSVDDWPKTQLNQYLRAYDSKETVQVLWERHIRFCEDSELYFPWKETTCNHEREYKKINFPLLVIHGDKDPLSTIEHPEYVMRHVKHAQMRRFANGNHDLHQRFGASYRTVVENFFLKDL